MKPFFNDTKSALFFLLYFKHKWTSFYLKTAAGIGTENTISCVTNNGTSSGTVSWTPSSAGTYYYQCSLHGGMVGTITAQQ